MAAPTKNELAALAARYFKHLKALKSIGVLSTEEDPERDPAAYAVLVQRATTLEDWGVSDEVDEVMRPGGESGWALVRALVARAPTDELLMVAAAGPIENFLRCTKLRGLADRVEKLARRDRRFRMAFLGTWGLPPRFARIQARFGVRPVPPA